MLLLTTRHRLFYLYKGRLEAYSAEGLLDSEGRPSYQRLQQALEKVGRNGYLGLGSEFALLRLQSFPNPQGFSLKEAVLAEAERSPLFAGEELVTDYFLTGPEDEHRMQVLYTSMPKKGAALLGRLRPRRVEPLPLILWRYALARSKGDSLLVVENLTHSIALFAGGSLRGFRYLTLPADEGTLELTEEITRSLALFGQTAPVDEAWLLGLPEPPRLPPELSAKRVEQAVPLNLEAFLTTPGPLLDLRLRRQPLGNELPKEAQLSIFLASFLFSLGLLGSVFLNQKAEQEGRRVRVLRQEAELLRQQAFQPVSPQGLGPEEVLKVAAERPNTLWLTRLEAEKGRLFLEGNALDPYAPLLLAQKLGGKVGPLQRSTLEGKTIYTWEVEVVQTQAR
jgi:hypothetical protein